MRTLIGAAVIAAVAGIASPASADTGTPVLTGVALHDGGAVMQSFARTSAAGTWIFSQVMQDGRFGQSHAYHLEHGDLTLSHVSADGSRVLSYMYLRGFGHGEAISVQPASPGLWIWTEAVSRQGPTASTDGFGTRIARFKWTAGRTITPSSPGVQIFNPNPGTFHNAPSVVGGLIAARYMTADKKAHFAVYQLADFLAHNYTALERIDQIPAPGTGQGWALMPGGHQIAWLTGDHTSAANPPPGNTRLTVFDANGIVSQVAVTDAPGLSWREPEGVQPMAGQLCYGFAYGPANARRANLYCR